MTARSDPSPDRDLFSSTAPDYRRFRPRYPRTLADYLSELAPSDSLVWEAGCGSGQLSTILTHAFGCIVASDASWRQIAEAPRRPRLHYLVERAESSALADDVANLCVSAQAAHWFDVDRYYSEVKRVGKRGGFLALITYGRVAGPPKLQPLLEQLYGMVQSYWPPERDKVEEAYSTLTFPFYEIATPALEIRESWRVDKFLGYVSTWSAVQALRRETGETAFDDFVATVRRDWSIDGPTKDLRWPLSLRVGRI